MILRFLLPIPVWFVGTFILPWVLVPVAVAFADKDGRLPRPFRWLETHDNLGFAGLDTEPDVQTFTAKWGRRIGLVRWLWRNKAYTLRYRLGIPFHRPIPVEWKVLSVRGAVKPQGVSCLWIVVEAGGKRYFELQPGYGWGGKRLYMRIGWKLYRLAMYPGDYPNGSTGMYTGITPRLKR